MQAHRDAYGHMHREENRNGENPERGADCSAMKRWQERHNLPLFGRKRCHDRRSCRNGGGGKGTSQNKVNVKQYTNIMGSSKTKKGKSALRRCRP